MFQKLEPFQWIITTSYWGQRLSGPVTPLPLTPQTLLAREGAERARPPASPQWALKGSSCLRDSDTAPHPRGSSGLSGDLQSRTSAGQVEAGQGGIWTTSQASSGPHTPPCYCLRAPPDALVSLECTHLLLHIPRYPRCGGRQGPRLYRVVNQGFCTQLRPIPSVF